MSNKQNTYMISFNIDTEDGIQIDSFKRLEHHIEELLDLDSWPEIKSVYNVKVQETDSTSYLQLFINSMYLEIKQRWNRLRVKLDADTDELKFLVHLMEIIEQNTGD